MINWIGIWKEVKDVMLPVFILVGVAIVAKEAKSINRSMERLIDTVESIAYD